VKRAILFTLALATAGVVHADELEVVGQAALLGTDRAKARQRALDEAFRTGLEQTLTTLWGEDELKRRSSELRVRVYPNVRAYITSYRVIDENELGGAYHVRIAAQYSTDKLAELRGHAASTASETALLCATGGDADLVGKAVDHALGKSGYKTERVKGACDAASLQAALSGKLRAIGILAAGQAGAIEPIRGTQLIGAEVRVQVDRFAGPRHDTANETATTYGEGAATHSSLASLPSAKLSEGYEQAADNAVRKLFGESKTTASTGGGVNVKIVGLTDYASYASVVRTTSQLPDVRGVTPRRFARGEAELLVSTSQNATRLADELRRGSATLSVQPQPDGTVLVTLPRPDGT
jgi:hypothetical protein